MFTKEKKRKKSLTHFPLVHLTPEYDGQILQENKQVNIFIDVSSFYVTFISSFLFLFFHSISRKQRGTLRQHARDVSCLKKKKKKNIKITRDGREPGLLRGVCFFVYDMVQRTSAGCPVQPERGVTSVLAQSHVLNTQQAL